MRIIRSLVILCGLGCLFVPASFAQITGDIHANIPFSFYVQETKLPAGEYVLHVMQDTDLMVMEIRSADDKTAVTFQVDASQLPKPPNQTELLFHRYGNSEYLSRIFESGSADGSRVVPTRAELHMQKSGNKPEEHAIPAEKR
jgi:hypothetical protein